MMRFWVVLAFLILPSLLVAQTEPVPAGESALLEWDHSGEDMNGAAETLERFQVAALTADGLTLIRSMDVPVTQQGAQTASVNLSELALSAGVYQMRVRAVDVAGNVSDWSEPLLVAYEVVAPVAPSKPRVKVTVIVEIG